MNIKRVFPQYVLDAIAKIQPMDKPEGRIFYLEPLVGLGEFSGANAARSLLALEQGNVTGAMDLLINDPSIQAMITLVREADELLEAINKQGTPPGMTQENLERGYQLMAEGSFEDATALFEEYMSPELLKLGYLILGILGFPIPEKEIPKDISSAQHMVESSFSEEAGQDET